MLNSLKIHPFSFFKYLVIGVIDAEEDPDLNFVWLLFLVDTFSSKEDLLYLSFIFNFKLLKSFGLRLVFVGNGIVDFITVSESSKSFRFSLSLYQVFSPTLSLFPLRIFLVRRISSKSSTEITVVVLLLFFLIFTS